MHRRRVAALFAGSARAEAHFGPVPCFSSEDLSSTLKLQAGNKKTAERRPGGLSKHDPNYRYRAIRPELSVKQTIDRGIFGGWFYERSCEPKTIEAHHGWRDLASNTHLHGDVRCRALLRGLTSAVAKTLLSMPDLRRRVLAEIRQQPGCHNVQDIAINRVTGRAGK